MDRARLDEILAERSSNPEAYKKDGYIYFEEALPLLEDMLSIREVKPKRKNILEESIEEAVEETIAELLTPKKKKRPEVEITPPKKKAKKKK